VPYVKPISGHTRLDGAQRYLERDGRALARDFLNMDAPLEGLGKDGLPDYGDYDWASVMDATREALGNDAPWKGRRARTYKHYVLSPDPRDGIGLSELRSVTMSWVRENFADYEVAVVYHDDNEHRIPHAHVVVNNTNLVTGRRLQDPDPRELKRSAQRIAKERGLSFYADEPRDPETGVIPDSDPYARRNAHIVERDLVSKGEYSWVADIRARVDVARGLARDPEGFREALAGMGVAVRESASRRGDWVYSLAEMPSRQVTGSRLGASYTRREVTSWLRSPTRHAPTQLTARNVRQAAEGAIEVRDLGELVRLSEAVSVVSRGDFRSLAAMDAAAARMRDMPGRDASAARIERARAFCAERGILPESSAMSARGRARASAGAATDSHRHGQQAHGGHQPRAAQHQRRDERGGR
jgi:hypothetical protein